MALVRAPGIYIYIRNVTVPIDIQMVGPSRSMDITKPMDSAEQRNRPVPVTGATGLGHSPTSEARVRGWRGTAIGGLSEDIALQCSEI